MKHKHADMNAARGFTLIELMIVVAIIGILASIAIPAAYQYRQKAFEDSVVSDVRNAVSIEEGYFAENQAYKAFGPVTGHTVYALGTGLDLHISKGVTLTGTLADDGSLLIEGTHPGAIKSISYQTAVGMLP
ncbi:MAG: hypothetical protein COS82_01785 [Zetaproteobacteria bacterium CG06_land_8_20_14_3_00_59_53]|nr:MAG: hypothetical protein AUK36_10620 [Zetaproteobacteria bacterium CG2_30_59_37]PIO90224.1 MAG: hypothetical protein COX56_03470 [Zetaproteobacteria bacterium CG23_combo_of_CG06-09_8_20_14_all_59_86]PIQ64571.1 MAG: hypothetical protein COV97_08325 [Zetaproteobacteria bacterium CG11_big_fil_rev_8_21_14_0_20_59_439]PIU71271.1 MAG: hypothetical protein COS82_01785 [Zetaproteobacteria bacterium CG06_land_8_20_14_3_00_59_53]PIU97206.1 MAG: hypothetical protein COS62_04780 [Zetaproteobacteria bac